MSSMSELDSLSSDGRGRGWKKEIYKSRNIYLSIYIDVDIYILSQLRDVQKEKAGVDDWMKTLWI